MIKPYHVEHYIVSGIMDNTRNAEDPIEVNIKNSASSALEVEFIDHNNSSPTKTKYKITIESID
jgi:hypothetical protein